MIIESEFTQSWASELQAKKFCTNLLIYNNRLSYTIIIFFIISGFSGFISRLIVNIQQDRGGKGRHINRIIQLQVVKT